jgi:hypothetical protein
MRAGYHIDAPYQDIDELANTALQAGIPVSKGGLEKLNDSLADLRQAVQDRVNIGTENFRGLKILSSFLERGRMRFAAVCPLRQRTTLPVVSVRCRPCAVRAEEGTPRSQEHSQAKNTHPFGW